MVSSLKDFLVYFSMYFFFPLSRTFAIILRSFLFVKHFLNFFYFIFLLDFFLLLGIKKLVISLLVFSCVRSLLLTLSCYYFNFLCPLAWYVLILTSYSTFVNTFFHFFWTFFHYTIYCGLFLIIYTICVDYNKKKNCNKSLQFLYQPILNHI